MVNQNPIQPEPDFGLSDSPKPIDFMRQTRAIAMLQMESNLRAFEAAMAVAVSQRAMASTEMGLV